MLILGAGDLGSNLRSRLVPFGVSVTMVAHTAHDGAHGMRELPGLLGSHDAVVIMVPYSEETHHLVDAAFLARMPDGAVIVNAARGPVVDTGALLGELYRQRLRAVLDVTDPEPLPPAHPLWDAPGVLITPHVGGNTEGGMGRAGGWRRARSPTRPARIPRTWSPPDPRQPRPLLARRPRPIPDPQLPYPPRKPRTPIAHHSSPIPPRTCAISARGTAEIE